MQILEVLDTSSIMTFPRLQTNMSTALDEQDVLAIVDKLWAFMTQSKTLVWPGIWSEYWKMLVYFLAH